MKILQDLVDLCRMKVFHGGRCPLLVEIKEEYQNYYGILERNTPEYTGVMNNKVGKMIADAYTALVHDPEDRLVKAAYDQLAKEVVQQFNFLNRKEKIIYEPFEGKGEPYKNSYEMLKDFHNYHLYFFKTECGFGENGSALENKMLERTGIRYNGYELVINDLFRIVHDIFGHAMNGYGFGAKGEDKAWHTHKKMFSPLAAAALSTETRGQNCWVNFGPHMRDAMGNIRNSHDPRFIPAEDRPFADQKMNLLPVLMSGIRVYEEKEKVMAAFLDHWDPLLGVDIINN